MVFFFAADMGGHGRCLKYLQRISKKLNEKVLQQILAQVARTDNVTLKGWVDRNSDCSAVKGEHYLADIHRFNIHGTNKDNGYAS